jgi:hypothetical protein
MQLGYFREHHPRKNGPKTPKLRKKCVSPEIIRAGGLLCSFVRASARTPAKNHRLDDMTEIKHG